MVVTTHDDRKVELSASPLVLNLVQVAKGQNHIASETREVFQVDQYGIIAFEDKGISVLRKRS